MAQRYKSAGNGKNGWMPQAQDDAALGAALSPGGIRMLYQPLVDLESGEVLGYEALARGTEGSPLEHPEALLAAATSGAK